MKLDLTILENRHDASPEELSEYVSANFNVNLLTLRQLEPFVREIKRRFKILPRSIDVNGNYRTIGRYRSFKSWCLGDLHRTDRTVRYMLAVGQGTERKKKAETLSAVLIRSVKYIKRQRIDKSTKKAVITVLRKRLEIAEHETRNKIKRRNTTTSSSTGEGSYGHTEDKIRAS